MDAELYRTWRDLLGADEERLVAVGECRLTGAGGDTLDLDAEIPPGTEPLELKLIPRQPHRLLTDERPSLGKCLVLVVPADEDCVPMASVIVRSFQWNGIPCIGVRADQDLEKLAKTHGPPDATACGLIAVGQWLSRLTELRESWSADSTGRKLLLGCIPKQGWQVPPEIAVGCLPSFAQAPAAEGDILMACREIALSFDYDATCYQYPSGVQKKKAQLEIKAIEEGFLHWDSGLSIEDIRESLPTFVEKYLRSCRTSPPSNEVLRRLVMETPPMFELCDQAHIDPVKERVPMKKVFELWVATQLKPTLPIGMP